MAMLVFVVVVVWYFYVPSWGVETASRVGEIGGRPINIITAARAFSDFGVSEELGGLVAGVAELPSGTDILSLHVLVKEKFMGLNGAEPYLQALIKNADSSECAIDIANSEREVQQIAVGKMCAVDQESALILKDVSGLASLTAGKIEIFVSYITF